VELMKSRVLELNASDERGIKVVREKIKTFAQVSVSNESHGDVTISPKCPPYKLVILDEADAMTADAQSALRRVIEVYSKSTRFCLICNYINRIIEPISSRCARFRFRPLGEAMSQAHIKLICAQEQVNISDDAVKALESFTEGDLRRSIMLLQSAHLVYKQSGKTISAQDVSELAGHVPSAIIDRFMKVATSKTGTFAALETVVRDVVAAGYSAYQLVQQLADCIAMWEPSDALTLTDRQKAQLAERLGHTDRLLAEGADEHLQILSFASFLRTTVVT
jgi:replication factor C subunit 2/4